MLDWHDLSEQPQRYVLLDRDGVINQRVKNGYVTSWSQFQFLPRTLRALRLLGEAGYEILVVSNQACVGKGLLSSDELDSITRKFLLEVALCGGNIAQVYYCRHREEDRCTCRKPLPGLIIRARLEHGFLPAQTYLIGDSPSDIAAATAAGCPSILIQNRESPHPSQVPRDEQQLAALDLYEAAELLIAMNSPQFAEDALVSNYRDRT